MVTLKPNEHQGKYQWQSLFYEVDQDLLTDISAAWLEDVGELTPVMWNHLKWTIQRTLFYNSLNGKVIDNED